jgi:hypothetical protein
MSEDTQKTPTVKPREKRQKSRRERVSPAPVAVERPKEEPGLAVARRWAKRLIVPVFASLPLACAAAVRLGDAIPADVWAAAFAGLGGLLGAIVKWLLGEPERR